jgi:type I restriction enzyme S subunit
MKIKTIPSEWLAQGDHRLDCIPYLSGAIEARVLLDKMHVEKVPLRSVTKGGMAGIFNGPRFPRNYVDDPEHGVPFLGSTDILAADLSWLPFISKKQVAAIPELLIDEGWTLITCSGTIGRMAYARTEMKGMAGSQHFMRVVPDPDKILPGCLYAYLSSKFGVPLVVSGTYGAIIQHIEPHHIADLPVPRLGGQIENEAHDCISSAASNRGEAAQLLQQASRDFIDHFNLPHPKSNFHYPNPNTSIAQSSTLIQRMDAYYYAEWNKDARATFDLVPAEQSKPLSEVTTELYIPDIFKRQYVDDATFGYPYITGADVYMLAPTSDRYLSKKVPNVERLVLREGMILVQDSGQLGGLIGRPVPVGRYLNGFACTNNMIRIISRTEADQGYIFAVLNSNYGIRLLTREATGSSIPHLDERRIKQIKIPWAGREVRESIGGKVMKAIELRDKACELEAEARQIIEGAIEKGSS